MGNDDSEKRPGTITDAAKAIAAITEHVPVYQDAVQPAAKELGKSFATVAKAVNAALVPVEGLVWGIGKVKEFITTKVAKKLQNVPTEDIQTPRPHIGVPVIEALRYIGEEPNLADMYSNLLATSMNKKTSNSAHPAYVDIIKNINPDEAKIIKFLAANNYQPLIEANVVDTRTKQFRNTYKYISLIATDAGCEAPSNAESYMTNLKRLGLVETSDSRFLSNSGLYDRIQQQPPVHGMLKAFRDNPEFEVILKKGKLEVTAFGIEFMKTCVGIPDSHSIPPTTALPEPSDRPARWG